jgi:hypothetical protein
MKKSLKFLLINSSCSLNNILDRNRKQVKNIIESQIIDLQGLKYGLYLLSIKSQGKNQVMKIVIE